MKWLQSEKQQNISLEWNALAEDAGAVLHALPWGLMKSGASGDEPIYVIEKYLGSSWATGAMECDMLDHLADPPS